MVDSDVTVFWCAKITGKITDTCTVPPCFQVGVLNFCYKGYISFHVIVRGLDSADVTDSINFCETVSHLTPADYPYYGDSVSVIANGIHTGLVPFVDMVLTSVTFSHVLARKAFAVVVTRSNEKIIESQAVDI